jgi:UDP-2,3-diacylglucosamine pyrophosphatase LpxH
LPYWSLSRFLKLRVKRAVSYVNDFESAVAREARRRGAQGVVCGHIHHAELREIDGMLYANDGDWVESLTALLEYPDGSLKILDWLEWKRERSAALHGADFAQEFLPAEAEAPVLSAVSASRD